MTDSLLLPEHLQRLWFVHSMAQDKALLNIGADVIIRGSFLPEELRTAFVAAVGRHDAFRLRFRLGKSGPECQLLDSSLVRWRVEDLGHCLEPVPDRVHSRIAEAERLPLRVEEGSLIRGTLYLLGEDSAVLAVTAHHLVADAWTIRVLVQDILHEWRKMRGEAVSALTPPGSVLEVLRQPHSCAATGASACSSQPPLQLSLDRTVRREERSGNGNEVVVRLGGSLCQRVRRLCAETGQTVFAGLAGALLIHLGGICSTPTVEAGILVTTRDVRRQRKTAGCFVQAASVAAEIASVTTPLRVIQDVGNRVRDLWGRAQHGTLPAGGRFPVMISMVRDSSVRLVGPAGVSVRYERRRRTQAECDLHVFLYRHTEDVEVVFNYDSDVLNADTVASWRDEYVRLIERICESPHMPVTAARSDCRACGSDKESPIVACRLQHIGLAAWELDIGLRRLASAGIVIQGQPWENHAIGVAMALAGPPEGVQLEVVAPLCEDAPCVGTLTQEGEGPYHCCWLVSDLEAVLRALSQHYVRHTVIQRNGTSSLFPSETVTFVIVDGFGLVEFLHGVPVVRNSKRLRTDGSALRVCIESDDMLNARRFMALLGHHQVAEGTQEGQHELWLDPHAGHVFGFAPVKERRTSGIAWIAHAQQDTLLSATCFRMLAISEYKNTTTWWSRFRVDSATS